MGMKRFVEVFFAKTRVQKSSPSVRNNCQDLSVLQNVL